MDQMNGTMLEDRQWNGKIVFGAGWAESALTPLMILKYEFN
jgi:hypothetical protein